MITITCRIETIETLGADVHRVFLRTDQPVVTHAPGQYLELDSGRAWLPFSIASAPRSDGLIELHVQYVAASENSQTLFERLRVGEMIDARLPGGECSFELGDPRPLLLIAAGTGFAQMKSIIEAALAHDPGHDIHLWWAGREREELYLESLVRRWVDEYPNVRFTPVVELPGEEDFDGVVERIDRALHERVGSTREASIFIAGSPGMVYAVVDTLEALEPLTERVFSDVFSYAPRQPARGGTP
ncbi:CDP-4-dehydro-6-deoxyglucose reductase [Kushneria sinocarnis]|uniref:CDP-4-dehydro-6-deoxyglucose reductase n=1 Tax=Kushneria sinocarnis TaxID=595502 RepID=A0A420WXG2_9GAMM|nr:FAD-binding oxidoreductase [Kushneria sinocarnis]RKR04426.1 CDP-4-dehydro-6-deoxyglucose reductase [Kushneria sinocarnis]